MVKNFPNQSGRYDFVLQFVNKRIVLDHIPLTFCEVFINPEISVVRFVAQLLFLPKWLGSQVKLLARSAGSSQSSQSSPLH